MRACLFLFVVVCSCTPCREYYRALDGIPNAHIRDTEQTYRGYFRDKFKLMIEDGNTCEEIRDSLRREMYRLDPEKLRKKTFKLKNS